MKTKNTKFILILLISLALCLMPLVYAQTPALKSDKPTAEVFVFSYCPYAAQFEKALFPVYNLLKNKVDFNIIYIGSMHGTYEETENLRQICIKKLYGERDFMHYLQNFATNKNLSGCGDDSCRIGVVNAILKDLNMNKNAISFCMKNKGQSIYDSQLTYSGKLGILASPTFRVNGNEFTPRRSPEGIKETICNALPKAPKECNKLLSDEVAITGFG